MQRGRTRISTHHEGERPRRVWVDGHELTIYVESPPMIEAMLDDIRAAQHRVWMEMYIFADDDAGRAVADALSQRAAAGLDVRLMVDALGSFSTPQALFQPMRSAGVQVHQFHALGQALRAPRIFQVLNQRNHRKLLVVDDQIAYFGGMNVVDQSRIHDVGDAEKRRLPKSAGWRDVQVRMVGPRQAEIAAACERLWQRVHHQQAKHKERPWTLAGLRNPKAEEMFFFDSRPNFKNRRPQRVLAPLIQGAQLEITMAMAYFVPLGRVLRELVRAKRRGVTVRVIVPETSDVKVVQWATRHFYENLLRKGIRIYERLDRMLHSKAMVIDQRWSVIGSCNLDARSLRLNLEFFAVIHSQELAQAIDDICRQEIAASQRVTFESIRNRYWWQRVVHRAAWALRKWL